MYFFQKLLFQSKIHLLGGQHHLYALLNTVMREYLKIKGPVIKVFYKQEIVITTSFYTIYSIFHQLTIL